MERKPFFVIGGKRKSFAKTLVCYFLQSNNANLSHKRNLMFRSHFRFISRANERKKCEFSIVDSFLHPQIRENGVVYSFRRHLGKNKKTQNSNS